MRDRYEHKIIWVAEHDLENQMNVQAEKGWQFAGTVGGIVTKDMVHGYRFAFVRKMEGRGA